MQFDTELQCSQPFPNVGKRTVDRLHFYPKVLYCPLCLLLRCSHIGTQPIIHKDKHS